MNLLRRYVEMPQVVWRDGRLTSDEKIMLAVVYSLGRRTGMIASWKDIAETLHVEMSAADRLVERLSGKGYLLIRKESGQRCRMEFGCGLVSSIERERGLPKVRLKMCFIQCLCTFDLRMDHVEQIRVCPECRRAVFYTEEDKKYLLRRCIGKRQINNR